MAEKVNADDLKKIGWSLVGGVVLTLIVIFATGWVVTSSTAEEQAEQKAEAAVEKRLAEFCVYQFKQSKNTDEQLQKLKEMDSWDRGDYIEKQGWATMPDKDSPGYGVADRCAEMVIEMQENQD